MSSERGIRCGIGVAGCSTPSIVSPSLVGFSARVVDVGLNAKLCNFLIVASLVFRAGASVRITGVEFLS